MIYSVSACDPLETEFRSNQDLDNVVSFDALFPNTKNYCAFVDTLIEYLTNTFTIASKSSTHACMKKFVQMMIQKNDTNLFHECRIFNLLKQRANSLIIGDGEMLRSCIIEFFCLSLLLMKLKQQTHWSNNQYEDLWLTTELRIHQNRQNIIYEDYMIVRDNDCGIMLKICNGVELLVSSMIEFSVQHGRPPVILLGHIHRDGFSNISKILDMDVVPYHDTRILVGEKIVQCHSYMLMQCPILLNHIVSFSGTSTTIDISKKVNNPVLFKYAIRMMYGLKPEIDPDDLDSWIGLLKILQTLNCTRLMDYCQNEICAFASRNNIDKIIKETGTLMMEELISIHNKMTESNNGITEQPKSKKPDPTMQNRNLKNFYEDTLLGLSKNKNHDVEIQTAAGRFGVHAVPLIASSNYFFNLLCGTFVENNSSVIKLPQIEFESVATRFIAKIYEINCSMDGVDVNELTNLIFVANEMQMTLLESDAVVALCDKITSDNALDILRMCHNTDVFGKNGCLVSTAQKCLDVGKLLEYTFGLENIINTNGDHGDNTSSKKMEVCD
jgi:hypothetical protein